MLSQLVGPAHVEIPYSPTGFRFLQPVVKLRSAGSQPAKRPAGGKCNDRSLRTTMRGGPILSESRAML